MQKGNFHRRSSAPKARKERSNQSYSASNVEWRAERSFHRPTFICPGSRGSDRKMTVSTHSHSQCLTVRYGLGVQEYFGRAKAACLGKYEAVFVLLLPGIRQRAIFLSDLRFLVHSLLITVQWFNQPVLSCRASFSFRSNPPFFCFCFYVNLRSVQKS